MNREIIKKAIKDKIQGKAELDALKRKMAKISGLPCPNNLTLLSTYRKLVSQGKIKKNEELEQILQTRPVRTLSGIAAITVLTKPYKCPGRCIYCPDEPGMPKSYLRGEPAAERAYLTHFNPYQQSAVRLASLDLTGHNTEKIELIILGGSFPAYPKKYQENFFKKCFWALNQHQAPLEINNNHEGCSFKPKFLTGQDKNLLDAQKRNETAYHRCVGLSIEMRPDQVNIANIKWWRYLGVTRVEIGVQTVFDDILKKNRRGHTVKDVTQATRLLKDWGFKVVYHIMPNLPGSNPSRDLATFKILFSDSRFQPDQIKIYPLVVLKTAPLYKPWQQGKYKPYSRAQLKKLLIRIKKIIPPYVRIIRIIRDIPQGDIVAGNKITNLRQILQQEKVKCRCIRCREAKNTPLEKPYYFLQKYSASEGTEYYLSYENKKQTTLYAHLRLRSPSQKSQFANSALIREVHTYGQVASLAQKQRAKIQHRGLGKKLIHKAENLALKNGYKKIIVISGIGVREYYRKLGYRLGRLGYMVKKLKVKSEK